MRAGNRPTSSWSPPACSRPTPTGRRPTPPASSRTSRSCPEAAAMLVTRQPVLRRFWYAVMPLARLQAGPQPFMLLGERLRLSLDASGEPQAVRLADPDALDPQAHALPPVQCQARYGHAWVALEAP